MEYIIRLECHEDTNTYPVLIETIKELVGLYGFRIIEEGQEEEVIKSALKTDLWKSGRVKVG